jgi:CRP-like cAMP-binding protein
MAEKAIPWLTEATKPVGTLDSELFRGLSAETQEAICQTAKVRHCLAGESFCVQGHTVVNLFVLRRGLAKVCGTGGSGKKVVLDWLSPGEAFGLEALLSAPAQHLWSVTAVEHSDALYWAKPEIGHLASLSPNTFENALQVAIRWSAQLQRRIEELSDGFVEQRVAHLLLHLAEKFTDDGLAELGLCDHEIAGMAGANLFSVNKLLRRWKQLGYIQKSRCRVVVLDHDNIERLSLPADQSLRIRGNSHRDRTAVS